MGMHLLYGKRRFLLSIGYPFLPCVYVRQVRYSNAFYIGATRDLLGRGYKMPELEEIFYFECFPAGTHMGAVLIRESELIAEFQSCGLSLVNKRI